MVKFCICGKTNSNQSLTDVHEEKLKKVSKHKSALIQESPRFLPYETGKRKDHHRHKAYRVCLLTGVQKANMAPEFMHIFPVVYNSFK